MQVVQLCKHASVQAGVFGALALCGSGASELLVGAAFTFHHRTASPPRRFIVSHSVHLDGASGSALPCAVLRCGVPYALAAYIPIEHQHLHSPGLQYQDTSYIPPIHATRARYVDPEPAPRSTIHEHVTIPSAVHSQVPSDCILHIAYCIRLAA